MSWQYMHPDQLRGAHAGLHIGYCRSARGPDWLHIGRETTLIVRRNPCSHGGNRASCPLYLSICACSGSPPSLLGASQITTTARSGGHCLSHPLKLCFGQEAKEAASQEVLDVKRLVDSRDNLTSYSRRDSTVSGEPPCFFGHNPS